MVGFIQKIIRQPLFLLGLIILAGTVLRLGVVNYPLDNPDVGRDLLVSRHIAVFGEHTFLGPANPVLGTFKNSPLYYYLLAAVLKIGSGFVAVGLANLALQISVIPMVFVIGKHLLNGRAGLVAALLTSFNPLVIAQSAYFWQPYLMGWFVSLSILLLVLCLKSKVYWLLITSAFCLATAVAINNAALAVVPTFLVISFFILRNWVKFLGVAATLFFATLTYFTPNLIYTLSESNFGLKIIEKFAPLSFPASLWNNLLFFGHEFFSLGATGLIIFIIALGWTLRTRRPEEEKIVILMGTIISFFLITAFFKLPWRADYFTPIFIPMVLLLAICVERISIKWLRLPLLGILLLLPSSKFDQKLPFNDLPKISAATTAIENKIMALKTSEGFADSNFFRIVYYPGKLDGEIVLSYDAVFWNGLEQDWDRKLTYLVSSDFGYRSLTGNDYLVLACREISAQECLDRLAQDQSTGRVSFIVGEGLFREVKSFYSQDRFTLYLMRRT